MVYFHGFILYFMQYRMDLGDVCCYPGNDRNSYGSFKIMEGTIIK